MFLMIWNSYGGLPELGLIVFLIVLIAVIVLKDFGYRRNPAPSAGTKREVSFYGRFYFCRGAGHCLFFMFAGRRQESADDAAGGILRGGGRSSGLATGTRDQPVAIAADFHRRGAFPVTAPLGFCPLPQGLPQMLEWLGAAACAGCWLESALLIMALGRKPGGSGSSAGPPAPAVAPVPGSPRTPLTGHAAH